MLQELFQNDTKTVAKKLLGMILVHKTPEGISSGRIVETEAYLHTDPAAHSYHGKTKRNSSMFEKAGTAYIYFTYGMHYCFNIVTAKEGVGEAVLIRALEPLHGIPLMQKRRGIETLLLLCNGPAKLVQALGISPRHNGVDLLTNKELFLQKKDPSLSFTVLRGRRIGIRKEHDLLLRFFVKDNAFISVCRKG